METKDILALVLGLAGFIVVIYCFGSFLFRRFKRKYLGSNYGYIVLLFIALYFFSVYISFYSPAPEAKGGSVSSWFSAILSAVSCFAFSLDFDFVSSSLFLGGLSTLVSVSYLLAGASAVIFFMVSIVHFLLKSFTPKAKNFAKALLFRKKVVIFGDPKVDSIIDIAKSFEREQVVIVVDQYSQSTQEGTEYKDKLINLGFDVQIANVSPEYLRRFVKKPSFLFRRKTTIFSMFYDDINNLTFALDAMKAVDHAYSGFFEKVESLKDEYEALAKSDNPNPRALALIKKKSNILLKELKEVRIYISYEDQEFEKNYAFEKKSHGIVRVYSEYRMVANDFVIQNPVSTFLGLDKLADVPDFKGHPELHVHFIGFGNVNQAIFLNMSSAYQLPGDGDYNHFHVLSMDGEADIEEYKTSYSGYPDKKARKGSYLPLPVLYSIDSPLGDGGDATKPNTLRKYISETSSCYQNGKVNIFVVSVGEPSTNIKASMLISKVLKEEVGVKAGKNYIYCYCKEDGIIDQVLSEDHEPIKAGDPRQYIIDNSNLDFGFPYYENAADPVIFFGKVKDRFLFDKSSIDVLNRIGKVINASYGYSYDVNKGFDSFHEHYNPLFAEEEWHSLGLAGRLSNTDPALQLRSKFEILGFPLDTRFAFKGRAEDIRKKTEETTVLTNICHMEHNRWVATSLNVFRYKQMPLETFLERNLAQSSVRKFYTKDNPNALHICMTTNKGLQDMKSFVLNHEEQLGKCFEKGNKQLEGAIDKLAFDSDYDSTIRMCYMLQEIIEDR